MEDEVPPLWKLALAALPQHVVDGARFGFHPQSALIFDIRMRAGRVAFKPATIVGDYPIKPQKETFS